MQAEELKSRWESIIASFPSEHMPKIVDEKEPEGEHATVDIANWLSRATIDVIGLAGFDYAFRSLEDETEEVYAAFKKMFIAMEKGTGMRKILELYFPILEKIFVSSRRNTL